MTHERINNATDWSIIPGWNEYKVSKNGDVFSIRRGRLLKVYTPINGYCRISLSQNGVEKTFCIHRLVAITFIPNPENKISVNHKDGNKQNNHVDNLEWCTYSENQKHAIKTGLAEVPKLPTGINHPCAKLDNVDIAMIRILLENDFTCDQIAKRFGVHPSYISALSTGKRRSITLTGEELNVKL